MVGLQGSGKTTTSAKLGLRLRTARAEEGAARLARRAAPGGAGAARRAGPPGRGRRACRSCRARTPVAIAARAIETAERQGYDVVILDTAGRLHIDDALMAELAAVRDRVRPHETLLVADALTGQDAVNLARAFHERIGISGIVLTRIDGDARGGAALSMRAVTGQPIKLVGTGEKLDALEAFHPDRMASRILGMGDVVSLVEKVGETVDKEEAEKLAAKMQKGSFDLEDLASQLQQMRKMGGMSGILGMLPGVGKIKQQMAEAKLDDGMIGRQLAIIELHDAQGAAQSADPARLAQAPDRRRRRHSACRRSTSC